MRKLFCSFLLLLPFIGATQKKPIDHTTYDKWNTFDNYQLSEQGAYLTYTVSKLKGNDTAYLFDIENEKLIDAIPRTSGLEINNGENIMAYEVEADFDTIRQLKLDGTDAKDLPDDTLRVYNIEKDTTHSFFPYEDYELNPEYPWVAYRSEKGCGCKKKKKKKEGFKTDGHWLHLLNTNTQKERIFKGVTEYTFSRKGNYLSFATHCKHNQDSVYLHVLDINSQEITRMYAGIEELDDLEFDYRENQLTFLAANDTSEVKSYELYHYIIGNDSATMVVDSLDKNMPKNWNVDDGNDPEFSRDGQYIYFGVSFFKDEPPEDTLLDDEKAKVDIWNYQDNRIQTRQLDQKNRDEARTFKAQYNIGKQKMTMLEDSSLFNVRTLDHGNAKIALGRDSRAYYRHWSYAFPWASDYYKVNRNTGERTLLKDSLTHNTTMDPSGRYFAYYNALDTNWYVINTKTMKESCLTCTIDEDFTRDANGQPYKALAEGTGGWLPDHRLILNARHDLWVVDPTFERVPYNITKNKGDSEVVDYGWGHFERDSSYIQLDESLVYAKDDTSKTYTIYKVSNSDTFALDSIYGGSFNFRALNKVNGKEQYFLRTETVDRFPDIQITKDGFSTLKTFTNLNPQQKNYKWADVQQVFWEAYDGKKLRGLLYTPEDLDTTKKHPMLVYFYERNSDRLNTYYKPKPTASIIYPTEYASNGYVVFIPDVEYDEGHPGKSAYNCIVSGTEAMVDRYSFIDSNKLGMQGQSWGGYQVAQLVTMTEKFEAAMAGAPVSNMFSAYGGIRWGSGLSRQFQYERTQSRIGGTIWDNTDLYIENSPIFHLPKVTTPLLIMHNDNDGAVPWYQGIELFMDLRRLNKPVWMLNYNGDSHNLRDMANKRDLSRRIKQFFDHFLKDEVAPIWMTEGIPAVKKQKKYGFSIDKQ